MGSNGFAVTRRTVVLGAGILAAGCLCGDGDGDATGDGGDEPDEPACKPPLSERVSASRVG